MCGAMPQQLEENPVRFDFIVADVFGDETSRETVKFEMPRE